MTRLLKKLYLKWRKTFYFPVHERAVPVDPLQGQEVAAVRQQDQHTAHLRRLVRGALRGWQVGEAIVLGARDAQPLGERDEPEARRGALGRRRRQQQPGGQAAAAARAHLPRAREPHRLHDHERVRQGRRLVAAPSSAKSNELKYINANLNECKKVTRKFKFKFI